MKKTTYLKKIVSKILFLIFISIFFYKPTVIRAADCGEQYSSCDADGNSVNIECNCSNGAHLLIIDVNDHCNNTYCCGWIFDDQCYSTSGAIQPAGKEFDKESLDLLNPLSITESTKKGVFNPDGNFSVAVFINEALNFIFPLAGLILFVMIVWGGFEMLTGAASKKNLDAGKQRVTAAIVGFLLLFCSYWIIQIVEQITGVNILG